MNDTVIINLPISKNEVPELRKLNGWDKQDNDYPLLFERCNFWAGSRDKDGKLIAFGYIAGTGLQHGYMEDILIHPAYQKQGIGVRLVKALLGEAEAGGLEIFTLTYDSKHTNFYQAGGLCHVQVEYDEKANKRSRGFMYCSPAFRVTAS